MVARPPLKVELGPMTVADLTEVQAIERASFTTPWPPHAYKSELETNRLASYLVARADGHVVGYGGVWLMVDEAHITTFVICSIQEPCPPSRALSTALSFWR